jgi:hypothetical protein
MRMSTAYFAGAGTVVVAVALGLGGGFLIAEMMNPTTPSRESTKLEHRSSDAPPQSAPNSYLAATQGAATTPVLVQPAAASPADKTADQSTDKPAQQPQSTADNKSQPQPATGGTPQPASAQPAVAPSSQPAHQQANAPEAAFAKASDADLKSNDKSTDTKARDADGRQAERERRRAERHQRWVQRHQEWTERHRNQRREPDMRDVEQAVRDDSMTRDAVARAAPSRDVARGAVQREYVIEPEAAPAPRFNLFGDDD